MDNPIAVELASVGCSTTAAHRIADLLVHRYLLGHGDPVSPDGLDGFPIETKGAAMRIATLLVGLRLRVDSRADLGFAADHAAWAVRRAAEQNAVAR
jgi:hypothetical protein